MELSVSRNEARILLLAVLAVSLLPLVVAWSTHGRATVTGSSDVTRANATNVTFVSEQGQVMQLNPHDGRLVAYHTDTERELWVHDDYRRYMDVDPLDADRVLFVAGRRTAAGEFQRITAVVNWRTGEELRRFPVPKDTHDVDALGDGRFAVADKHNDRLTVVDRNGSVRWAWAFASAYPASAGGPPADWTHLNDVDAVGNGSYLLSPRNFDRVLLLNRTNGTATVEWTLGEEDAYDTLHEQHNPVVLSRDPVTVLVADSENDRVVEYVRNGSAWNRTWTYSGDLDWPRDADRLPSGNTLIVDSQGDRALEVTPAGDVVWEVPTRRHPYDAERLSLGDEPSGPTTAAIRNGTNASVLGVDDDAAGEGIRSVTGVYRDAYGTASWVLPVWVDPGAFGSLLVTALLLVGWVGAELCLARWGE
jgi:hypothetical protein